MARTSAKSENPIKVCTEYEIPPSGEFHVTIDFFVTN